LIELTQLNRETFLEAQLQAKNCPQFELLDFQETSCVKFVIDSTPKSLMSAQHIEFFHVNRITIDTVGEQGQRIFLLQASADLETVTLKLEKEQARALAYAVQKLLDDIQERTSAPPTDFESSLTEADLALHPPLEPQFIVGQLGLGYAPEQDRAILVAQELVPEGHDDPATAQFWVTRNQLKILGDHTLQVVEEGRPSCPLCGQPIDPHGHFCPQRNGHGQKIQ